MSMRALPRPLSAVLTLAVVALTLASCGDSSESADAGPADGVPCDYVVGGEAAKEVDPPPANAAETGTVAVTISTDQGDLSAELDADAAPCTVNSFVSLAEQGYFDDTPCHRLTTAASGIYVLQCGDPSGSGSGGPGYSYADELTGSETYGPGTLAMANAGPDTNGSQFFIVYDTSPLQPDYTVFGQIDDASLATVDEIAAAGSDDAYSSGSGHPNTPVTITGVSVG